MLAVELFHFIYLVACTRLYKPGRSVGRSVRRSVAVYKARDLWQSALLSSKFILLIIYIYNFFHLFLHVLLLIPLLILNQTDDSSIDVRDIYARAVSNKVRDKLLNIRLKICG